MANTVPSARRKDTRLIALVSGEMKRRIDAKAASMEITTAELVRQSLAAMGV
jgi:hypothetical protein